MKIIQLLLAVILLAVANASRAADSTPASPTRLGIRDGEFTLNGKPTVLLGFSYYGARGAREDAVRRDLDDAQRLGFNWLRVWATWNAFGEDISAVGTNGTAATRSGSAARSPRRASGTGARSVLTRPIPDSTRRPAPST
ncbi:MAG: hypothetical protein ACYDH9_06215 [Limisphaerales bacterium]